MNAPLIKAIVILPGSALVYIPALILWLTGHSKYAADFPPTSMIAWATGLLFAAAGLALMIWTMRLFTIKGGGGTPAPWEPIQNFIVQGPYRHVRNPMLIGVILFLVAETILLQSFPILAWTISFAILNSFYFVFFEEPQLQARFGDAYAHYKRHVPRWIPRLKPYEREEN